MITIDINELAKLIGSLGVIIGVATAFIKWLNKREKTTEKVEALEEKEETDIEAIKQMHKDDMDKVQNELCVISYGLLAALDGLKQLGANGEVSKAHDKLSKHINQQAHEQL